MWFAFSSRTEHANLHAAFLFMYLKGQLLGMQQHCQSSWTEPICNVTESLVIAYERWRPAKTIPTISVRNLLVYLTFGRSCVSDGAKSSKARWDRARTPVLPVPYQSASNLTQGKDPSGTYYPSSFYEWGRMGYKTLAINPLYPVLWKAGLPSSSPYPQPLRQDIFCL